MRHFTAPAVRLRSARTSMGLLAAAGLAMGGLALGGCAVEKKLAFEGSAHQATMARGTASIEGEGFIRRKNAFLARCSGEVVYLVPDTAYFREWMEIYRAGNTVENAAALTSAHKAAVRKTQCNMKGKFTFENLPAGKWLLITRVTYDGEGAFSLTSQYDYTFVTEAQTKAGQLTPVILSNPNRI